MNNRGSLNLKYVIWGQKIWAPSDGVRAWTSWRTMENRGDLTQNHWYVGLVICVRDYVMLTLFLIGTTSISASIKRSYRSSASMSLDASRMAACKWANAD